MTLLKEINRSLTESWYTADDMEELYQKLKPMLKDKEQREKVLAVFNGVLGDERADDDDMEDLYQHFRSAKMFAKDEEQRKKILKAIKDFL